VKLNLMFVLLALLQLASAQSTISGTLYANDVKGFMVIGCLLDLTVNDCDYDKSPYVKLEQSGPSATFTLDNALAGQYLVIAWHDTNGNGQLEDDGSNELTYYTDAKGELALVTPPAAGITLRVGEALPSQPSSNPLGSNPLSEASAQNPLTSVSSVSPPATQTENSLLGKWSQFGGSSTSYYNPDTGEQAPLSGNAIDYTFNPDGSYEYFFFIQQTLYNCTTTISSFASGTFAVQDNVLSLSPKEHHTTSKDSCYASGNYEKDLPLGPDYYRFVFGRDIYDGKDYGETLELTSLKRNVQGEFDVNPEASTPTVLKRATP
jgi:hypothetical protein